MKSRSHWHAVSAKLPKLIKFTLLAYVDNTLVGQPGRTRSYQNGNTLEMQQKLGIGCVWSLLTNWLPKVWNDNQESCEGYETQMRLFSSCLEIQSDKSIKHHLRLLTKSIMTFVEAAKGATQHVASWYLRRWRWCILALLCSTSADAAALRKDAAQNWTKGSELGAETPERNTGEAWCSNRPHKQSRKR